jgi:alpha-N-arabinofuranosidase
VFAAPLATVEQKAKSEIMKMQARLPILPSICCLVLAAAQSVVAQANLPVYTDNLVNDFQDWSFYCTRSFVNTTAPYVHSGTYSISVTITNGSGSLYFHSPDFNTTPYTNLTFWINGGPTGGQHLQARAVINGNAATPFSLGTLSANSWQQFVIPLSTLGAGNAANFDGIWIQIASGSSTPVFYVDDIQLSAAPAPTTVNLSVDAAQVLRSADARWFGVNTAVWDASLGNLAALPLLTNAGVLTLRWPGGSQSDANYHWASDTAKNISFQSLATNLGAQVFTTVNYGSGTSNEAAGWVLWANITNHCHFKYWEIGNECYGSWEQDNNTVAHDPYTYAVRAAGYMAMMRAADPTVKIGCVAVPGDTSYANNMNHGVRNPHTGATNYGWTPVMLTTLSNLGVLPDFLIYHYYPQYTPTTPPWAFPNPSPDSDPLLLQVSTNWAGDAATLRQELTDYIGAPGSNIELCVTENNSDSSLGGRQLSSVVNSLYMVDAMSELMKTEFNSYLWWDFENGTGTGGDTDSTIYGWRPNGDEGIVTVNFGPTTTNNNPNFYGMKLMQYFVRPGDKVLQSGSSYQLLSAYGARKADGALAVLVINKDGTTNFNGQISLANYSPWTNATIYTYGMAQDNATKNGLSLALQDVAVTNTPVSGNPFTYSFPPYSMTVFVVPPAAPSLHAVSASGGSLVLQLQGQTGAPYVIQTSTDLLSWNPVSTNMLATSPMNVTNSFSPGSARFWRAYWKP